MPKQSKEEWHAYFPLSSQADTEKVIGWLMEKPDGEKTRLRAGNAIKSNEGGVTTVSPTKDEAFAVGEFVRNANPLGRKLFYSVRGYDKKGRKFFDTAWKKDFADDTKQLLEIVIVRDGRITLPRKLRVKFNIADGDKLALFAVDRRRILLTPSTDSKKGEED